METTRLSTKGQAVLPKNIRASRAWVPGAEFIVEETADGILLRPARRFPRTTLDEVAQIAQAVSDSPLQALPQSNSRRGRGLFALEGEAEDAGANGCGHPAGGDAAA
jgi:AbrB family looped-hinge helix DNA binding protein